MIIVYFKLTEEIHSKNGSVGDYAPSYGPDVLQETKSTPNILKLATPPPTHPQPALTTDKIAQLIVDGNEA